LREQDESGFIRFAPPLLCVFALISSLQRVNSATESAGWCWFNWMNNSEKESSFETDVLFWLVIICIVGFFVWRFIMPNFIRNGYPSSANSCINNLRQIDAAAQEFALETRKTNGEALNYPADLTPYIKLNKYGKIPPCPSGGIYSIKKVGDSPICSLSNTVTPAHVLP
jgi:hypothetical protein